MGKKGISSIISIIVLLLIAAVFASAGWNYLTSYQSGLTSKAISPGLILPRCSDRSASMYLNNIGTTTINLESAQENFEGSKNYVQDSGFEENNSDGFWEIQNPTNTQIVSDIKYYGNKSIRIEAANENRLISSHFRINYSSHYYFSNYIKVEGLTGGRLSASIYLYENEEDASNKIEGVSLELIQFQSPLDDSDFTKYSQVIESDMMDNECGGSPCEYARIVYQWSEGFPEGTVWVDDIFFGNYVPYLETIGTREAKIGDLVIMKTEGDGDLYPYIDQKKIEPNEQVVIKDANCMSDNCEYFVTTGYTSNEIPVMC